MDATQTSETNEVKVEAKITQNKPFTEDELEIAWRRFADTIPEQTRLTSFILGNRPILLTETTFEITVNNNSQEKEFNRLKPDIVVFLRYQLQNSSISMNIKMVEETERTRGTSPEDRFRLMTEQNPALAKLRDGLNLEID
jgi:DNA polymerase-3 subunit gamma/tau